MRGGGFLSTALDKGIRFDMNRPLRLISRLICEWIVTVLFRCGVCLIISYLLLLVNLVQVSAIYMNKVILLLI